MIALYMNRRDYENEIRSLLMAFYGTAVQLYLLPAAPYFCRHSQPSCFALPKNQKVFWFICKLIVVFWRNL